MTAKEKAKELINKYSKLESDYEDTMSYSICKECALIAVNEVILALTSTVIDWIRWEQTKKYWQEVKTEITQL